MVELITNLALNAAALYLAVLVHELLHLLACLALKVPFDKLYIGTKTKGNYRLWFKFKGVLFVFYLLPIGGGVHIYGLSLADARRIGLVALAGPVGGFLLSSAVGVLIILGTDNHQAIYFATWLLIVSTLLNGLSLRDIRGYDGQTARVMLSGDEDRIITWLEGGTKA